MNTESKAGFPKVEMASNPEVASFFKSLHLELGDTILFNNTAIDESTGQPAGEWEQMEIVGMNFAMKADETLDLSQPLLSCQRQGRFVQIDTKDFKHGCVKRADGSLVSLPN